MLLLPGLEKAYKVLCKRMNYVGFSKSTIYNAELVVRSLNTFMVRNGIDEYDKDCGARFLLDQTIYPGNKKFKEPVIRRLNDCCGFTGFWLRHYPVPSTYTPRCESLRDLYRKMLHDLERLGYSKDKYIDSRRCIFSVDVFMKERCLFQYSEEVGVQFLSWVGDGFPGTLPSYRHVFCQNVDVLNDYLHSCFPRLKSMSPLYRFNNPVFNDALAELLARFDQNGYADKSSPENIRAAIVLDYYMELLHIDSYTDQVGSDCIQWYFQNRQLARNPKAFKALIHHLGDVLMGRDYCPLHHEYIDRSIVVKGFQPSYDQYISFCKEERLNRSQTITEKQYELGLFFQDLAGSGCTCPEELTPQLVVESCAKRPAYKRGAVKGFLQFCHEEAIIAKDLSRLVPKRKRRFVIPPYYTKEERKRLESACGEGIMCGRRNHAIILLINRLGLRSSDVCQLGVDQFDRQNKSFVFHQKKTGSPVVLPILDSVADAVQDYIDNERPRSRSSCLFLEAYAPHTPLTRAAIYHVYEKYIKIAGIEVAGRRHGGHAFRASIASSMINNGLPYELVRQVMGHSSPDMLRHYATLDIDRLRLCALDAPPATGRFLDFLSGRKGYKQ